MMPWLCLTIVSILMVMSSDNFNRFDFITIVLGIVEAMVSPPSILDGTPGRISPFVALRALRGLKIAQSVKSLNRLLMGIFSASGEILNFLVLLVLFIYIYALLGMEVLPQMMMMMMIYIYIYIYHHLYSFLRQSFNLIARIEFCRSMARIQATASDRISIRFTGRFSRSFKLLRTTIGQRYCVITQRIISIYVYYARRSCTMGG
jgi:hypothetical protein